MFTKMTDDIYKLVVQFPFGMGNVNSYLIEGTNGYTVIDTGTNQQEAIDIWEEVLKSGIKVEKVVLTHTHEDHIGLARWFQEVVGVPVIVSKEGLEVMERRRNLSLEQFNQLIKKYGGDELSKGSRGEISIFDFTPDELFEETQPIKLGDYLYETIWTPGHAEDQYCFYNQEKGTMIVGDHVLKEVSPVIGLWSGVEFNPLKDYFSSLDKVENYLPKISLPGHGEPIFDLQQRVVEIREKHQYRLEQIYHMVENEPKTVTQVCEEIYGENYQISAFMAIITRFIYLEDIGHVERRVMEGEINFLAIEK
ncbi:MBL fold metallo-hydrolase [Oceanobacillus senegalensis]|uniref:MBL fold metallo-hydrolase n=1 Tax=Oceanobacillus senegalensis TaxID=1936063 RepID=UPI000A30F6EF|nr:MBL fold metallo-hydrolase [Oceanobacillus senegalensis]